MSKDNIDKALTVGYAGTKAPSSKVGAESEAKESMDRKVKQTGTCNAAKKKKKLKILKAIMQLKQSYPTVSINSLVNLFLSRMEYRVKKSKDPNCLDKELFKSIFKKTRLAYPNTDLNEIAQIATEVYRKVVKAKKKFSKEDAERIGKKLKVDFNKVDINEFTMGLNVELEHSNITHGNEEETAKIAIAHLDEKKDYYTKLKQMEGK